jgi:hypothetical protein
MLRNDVLLAFKELGWKTAKDEGGEHYAIFELGSFLVQVILKLEPRKEGKSLQCYFSVSNKELDVAAARIFGERETHTPLITDSDNLRQPDFTFEDIRALSARLIEWARRQDIDAALKGLRELPTDAKGAMPLRHLAALALAGDVDRLEYYQRGFEAGDRLGFVPYISKEMIDRAVEIAKDVTSSCLEEESWQSIEL